VTRYILSEDADRDLDDIRDYIAAANVDAADRWIGKLFDAFDAIESHARWLMKLARSTDQGFALVGN
jgi:plasmid stabilization system protein ParE